jgi:hypothetical protein
MHLMRTKIGEQSESSVLIICDSAKIVFGHLGMQYKYSLNVGFHLVGSTGERNTLSFHQKMECVQWPRTATS